MSGFLQKVRKLKGKPVHIIARKVAQKSYDAIYYRGRKIAVSKNLIDLEQELFKDYQPVCNFLFNVEKRENYVNKLKTLDAEVELIQDADKICNHVFNLLGSGDKRLGRKIPWNKDFKTEFVWENQFYKEIPIIDLRNDADVKVPWELSRFQHVFTLGKAYWVTGNEKYALEFREQVTDWIENNPVEMSVNWTCTMDVAIRAVNLICGYYFFNHSKEISKEFWELLNKSLYMHGKFIYKNLENKGNHTGNHYLSNIVGLVWLGLYFKGFKLPSDFWGNNPGKWLAYGISELEKEMFVQVNEDGTNYEASTSYHRLVTELFLITTILCNKNNITFSNEYAKRLERMCEFLLHLNQPNGKSPLIGDADDGRLLILSKYCSWSKDDFRHLLAVAGEFFNRDDFRYYGASYKEDAIWAIGKWHNVESQPLLMSKGFKDGGYYILRNEKVYCCIRCGELSFRGQGAHSHNDQLSFTLNINGKDFIVDPGSYVYTADYRKRNFYRSTNMHSTAIVNNAEQNEFKELDLFELKEQTFSKCTLFKQEEFQGKHYGYKEKFNVIHQRTFFLKNTNLEVVDEFLAESPSFYNLFLQLHPKVDLEQTSEGYILSYGDTKIALEIDGICEIKSTYISAGYGVEEESRKICIEGNGQKHSLRIKILEGR